MAALALPITELLPVVDEAKAETTQVVVCSKVQSADKLIVLRIAWKTLALRRRFADLAHRQTGLLDRLIQRDFSSFAESDMEELALLIDSLVASERDVLQQAAGLGSEIRAWWHTSLMRLQGQVEHLESIAESLHVAGNSEAATLLGIAVGQFAEKKSAVRRFAMK